MIDAHAFVAHLQRHDMCFFAGVPDSLLKPFCAWVADHVPEDQHIIAANEGGAVALAAGHHLATGGVGVVYMQNSGQGNAVNPLLSLADSAVYGIPMLLVLGWRGEPGRKDEPQHVKQGRVTLPLLDAMEIPYRVLPDDETQMAATVDEVVAGIRSSSAPAALVVRKGTFKASSGDSPAPLPERPAREEAIAAIARSLDDRDVVVATTGKASRELFEIRAAAGQGHQRDFLTVGSMGHASQIALAIALARPERRVLCLDGDGAAIMHMGGLAIIGAQGPSNLKHVVLNNGVHDSVGGQPTAAQTIDLGAVAGGCGYPWVRKAPDRDALAGLLAEFLSSEGPALLEVLVRPGARSDLGRPTTTPQSNKEGFMAFLRGDS